MAAFAKSLPPMIETEINPHAELMVILEELALTDWQRFKRHLEDLAERARAAREKAREEGIDTLSGLADVLQTGRKLSALEPILGDATALKAAVAARTATEADIAAARVRVARRGLHERWYREHWIILAQRGDSVAIAKLKRDHESENRKPPAGGTDERDPDGNVPLGAGEPSFSTPIPALNRWTEEELERQEQEFFAGDGRNGSTIPSGRVPTERDWMT